MWPFKKKTKPEPMSGHAGFKVEAMPRSSKHVRAKNALAFLKYLKRVYPHLTIGEPSHATPEGPWYGFDRRWTYTDAAIMIDARKIWDCTHMRLYTGTGPVGAELVVEFYADA